MFSDGQKNLVESFRATMSIFGLGVSVLTPDRIGIQAELVEPTLFYFYATGNQYVVTVGDKAEGRYIGLDAEGFFCIKSDGEKFHILDLENDFLVNSHYSQGEVVVNMYSAKSERAMMFDREGSFDDPEKLYNFLMVGRKVRELDVNRDVFYLVPSGRDTWVQSPANKDFMPLPLPIVLYIQ